MVVSVCVCAYECVCVHACVHACVHVCTCMPMLEVTRKMLNEVLQCICLYNYWVFIVI